MHLQDRPQTMMDPAHLEYAILGMIACVTFMLAYVTLPHLARKLVGAQTVGGTVMVDVSVAEYQGDGKPTLVRLTSAQESVDTWMWPSSLQLKIADYLKIEVFEGLIYSTFGPRFIGGATLSRREIETSWDPEECKPQQWIKIANSGHVVGNLKLETQVMKDDSAFSSATQEKSVFENIPKESQAHVRSADKNKTTQLQTVFESNPSQSKAYVRACDQIAATSQPAVFENVPLPTKADVVHGESDYETDYDTDSDQD